MIGHRAGDKAVAPIIRDKIEYMKEYRYLWRKLVEESTIRAAWKKLRKHKTKREDVKRIDANLDEEVRKMKLMLEHTRPSVDHPELGFWPKKHEPKIISERGKQRIIYVPDIIEQWVHYCVIQVLAPIIVATASPNTCGSLPRRGMHYGKRLIERWMRRKILSKYFLKCDIRHFFDSVRRDIAIKQLSARIKDDWFLYVIERCLIHFKKGLPLGFYISHWIANYLLEPFDYMLNRVNKHNIRYVDDVVLFGPNKREMRKLVSRMKMWLGRILRLKLKRNWCIVRFDYKGLYRPVDFMGFKFYRARTTIRKRILYAATKCARVIHDKIESGSKVYIKSIRRLLSYYGWFKNTKTYVTFKTWFENYIKPFTAKYIVSNFDKRKGVVYD